MAKSPTPPGLGPIAALKARLGRYLKRGHFVTQVLTLSTGTMVGQAFGVLAAPALTRLCGFSPADFAVAALFLSGSNLVYVVACGRYELAVMLPEKDEDAANVAVLSLFLSSVYALALVAVLALWGDRLLAFLGLRNTEGWMWYLPISAILFSWGALATRWQSRKKRFGTISKAQAGYGMTGPSVQVGAGLALAPARGVFLIWGRLLAQVFAVVVLFRRMLGDLHGLRRSIRWREMTARLRRYWRFPVFLGPSGLVSFGCVELPSFMLAAYFGPAVLGFYALGRRVLAAPMTFLGQAVSEVFFQRVAAARRDPARMRFMLLRVHVMLFAIILPLMLVLLLWAEDLFGFVFGAEWRQAGAYARLLVPMLAAHFVVWPTRMLLQAIMAQSVVFLWSLGYLGVTIAAFLLGKAYGSPDLAIGAYSVAATVMYAIYAGLSYHYLSKHPDALAEAARAAEAARDRAEP